MANRNEDEAFASDSKSLPAFSDHRFEVIKIGDTEPIDESKASIDDSLLLETPFENLYDDTELVDSSEETLDHEFISVDEVVDEDGENRRVASSESSLKAAEVLWESDGSNDQESQSGSGGLDCFVDEFLMGKDLNFSPVNLPGTNLRRKSPPFSGAKGRQSLAKRIKTISPTLKMSVFDWDSDQSDDVSSAHIAGFKRREDHDDYEVKNGSMDLCDNSKDSKYRFMQNSYAKRYKMEQEWGLTQGILIISQMDAQLQDNASKEQLESEEDFIAE